MRKVLEMIERSAKERSERFMDQKHALKIETVEETIEDYNPKTARTKSLKDLSIFSEN
ncbi:MAG TPA: hypothetical protein PKD85_09330 [Saprospiraceae bacterium]|nr:hypothetical protein [Saprospiraceae bacterium]